MIVNFLITFKKHFQYVEVKSNGSKNYFVFFYSKNSLKILALMKNS